MDQTATGLCLVSLAAGFLDVCNKRTSFRGRPFNSWGGRGGWVISGHQEFFFVLAIW